MTSSVSEVSPAFISTQHAVRSLSGLSVVVLTKIHCHKHFNLNERPVMCDQHKNVHVINAMDFFMERCSNLFSIALVKKSLVNQ